MVVQVQKVKKSAKVTSKTTQVPFLKKLATFGWLIDQDKSEKLQKGRKSEKSN